MTTPIVQLEDVSKSYATVGGGESVLRDVDLTIMPGEKASLIGPSGCGKSTLLLLIAGLLRPDTGTISTDGVASSHLDDQARARIRASRIGIALQSDNLVPFLSALENVEIALAFAARRREATHAPGLSSSSTGSGWLTAPTRSRATSPVGRPNGWRWRYRW